MAKVARVAAGALALAGTVSAAIADGGVAGSRPANAQANGGDQGSEGAHRVTEGWGTCLIQDGEDGRGIGGGGAPCSGLHLRLPLPVPLPPPLPPR